MKESVSAIFTTSDKIFFIKRQNYLSVFPGYYAGPGGKVDLADDLEMPASGIWPSNIKPQIIHALIREVKEELNFDLVQGICDGTVLSIKHIGIAVTPEFNPYRFKNYYFKIKLTHPLNFDWDKNEVELGVWDTADNFLNRYHAAEILVVPPMINLLSTLANDMEHDRPIEMGLKYDAEIEVPMIQSVYGVRQFLPLSNTFPPANRTNAFIIGDDDQTKYLVDPSPRDKIEFEKFVTSIEKIGFDKIFLTHHHPDHYEFSREIALQFKVPMEMSEFTFISIGASYFKGIEVIFRSEGDIITQSLGQDIFVYEVPGHDEGQLALAPRNLNWFLVGDLIQTVGTVVIAGPEGDMGKYFHSLKRVIDLNPKFLIPSHGIIIGGTDRLKETLKHRLEREEQIKELLHLGRTPKEILEVVYVGLKPDLLPYAFKTIEAHIVKIHNDKN